jgi:hypothetical protein
VLCAQHWSRSGPVVLDLNLAMAGCDASSAEFLHAFFGLFIFGVDMVSALSSQLAMLK